MVSRFADGVRPLVSERFLARPSPLLDPRCRGLMPSDAGLRPCRRPPDLVTFDALKHKWPSPDIAADLPWA
jgi:hypothetical protein